ncbi:MAG: four helix bundle protein [Sphingobacteriales bacterium BACL12 MAG-120813-bin55]|jgi:four helix bundle protein|nr:MAG: four helix bundle protein [Sphingobacteriales bacterium BACL12 MAG-120813-bin55]KRP09900.1 MAG: four helix bundle protein [Sphingobacteriales bacterium BACL12 MAG-120802-bin5]
MFDFEKLLVYQKAKLFQQGIKPLVEQVMPKDRILANQLRRAALSIPLNIAESTGRFTKPDKRNFFIIARGSVVECAAIFDIMHDENTLDDKTFQHLMGSAAELSKMLYGLIKSLS